MKVRGDSEGVCVASNLRNVAQAMAPRVAAAIAGRRIVLVQAPVEYAPAELVEAAMEVLHAPEGFRRFRVPEGTQGMLDAIGAGFPVLVELGSMEVADIAAIGDAVEERALHDLQAPVVVAAACDELPPLIERFPFEVFLDHLALVATPVEVSAVHPELGEMDARLHAVMHLTGGVPALVAVAGVTRPAYSEDLIRACGPWVERFYDEICADPVLLAHMWMPRASDHTLTTVASEVVGRPVTEQMLRDCRDNPLFTLAGPHNLCLPEAFAVAFQRTMRQRNRERVQSLERSLATVVRRTDKLRALDRVRLLGSWGDWEGVDRILSRSLHVLATQSPLQRAVWAESWPAVVPRRLPYLARARQFVESDWPRGAVPMAAVRVWHELTYLLRSEDAPPADSLLDRARKRFADALGRSTAGLEALRAEVGSMCDWLGNELHRHEDQGRRMRPDDVALLLALLVGVADTGIVVGEMTVSQVCVRRGLRLSRTGLRPDELPVMVPELLARGAFLAARSGLGAVAESYLAEYDELVERLGPRDLETERLASIAARHVLTIEAVLADPTVRLVDPEQPFAAHEAVSEAYRAFLVNGQAAGLEWVRSFLTRASWSSRPDWVWWPVHGVMALVEARDGRPGYAERWMARHPLPPSMDLIIRAMMELTGGRPLAALRMADQVLALDGVPHRWRLMAVGVKLACPEEATPEARMQSDMFLNSEDWTSLLGAVVLFPDRARKLVAERAGIDTSALPGLAVDAPQDATADVKLTPRQLEVLKALDSFDTMAGIAKSMYLGTETVRSTAKELYRRLGVHDRDSAVRMGRAMGII